MSDNLSMSVWVCDEPGDELEEWSGILIPDVQPLLNLIRHHGFHYDGHDYSYLTSKVIGGSKLTLQIIVSPD